MGGSQKSKKVTWASDVNLCQVRLFLSEESPSQVGVGGTQDHLQAKSLWPLHPGGVGSDDNLPPGFEGIQPENMWRVKLSQIPLMKWKCPRRFEINSNWQVVAGEESTEMEAQNEREMRVLEAIYPRPSAIPPNPAALVGIEDPANNDKETPLVPITAIEDEDAALDSSFGSMAANIPATMPQPQHFPFSYQGTAAAHPQVNGMSTTGFEPDIVSAAQAALTVMSNSDSGTLIDRDLLIKILSNPKMVEQLVTNQGASPSTQNMPQSSILPSMPIMGVPTMAPSIMHSSSHGRPAIEMQNVASFNTQNMPSSMHSMPSTSTQFTPNFRPMPMTINRRDPPASNITRPELIPPSMATASGPIYPPNRIGSIPNQRPSAPHGMSATSPSVGGPMTKDINYYKSLIQQHGEERREGLPQFSNQPLGTSQEPSNNTKSRDSKPKIMKPCMYSNGPRGCRNGTSCPFQHDTSSQQRVSGVSDVQSAKRVKLDREITGT